MNPSYSANLVAFLDMIPVSELGAGLIAVSDRGYNVIVGSTAAAPILFDSYADHPRRTIFLPSIQNWSSAAGRYQILARYFDAYRVQLHLPDFGPDSQDAIAVQLIHECGALQMIEGGAIAAAIAACSSRWASFPGAAYGQHVNKIDALLLSFTSAGGDLA